MLHDVDAGGLAACVDAGLYQGLEGQCPPLLTAAGLRWDRWSCDPARDALLFYFATCPRTWQI